MNKTLFLQNEQATLTLGKWLGRYLEINTIVLLWGDLGSGKTTLVKGIGQGLGIHESVDSPTFTLVNEYLGGRLPLYHVDLYRLEGEPVATHFVETYWDEAEYAPGIVAIEWPERRQDWPLDSLRVNLTYQLSSGRKAVLTPATPSQEKLLEGLTTDALLADEI